jgi:hypothetical protein
MVRGGGLQLFPKSRSNFRLTGFRTLTWRFILMTHNSDCPVHLPGAFGSVHVNSYIFLYVRGRNAMYTLCVRVRWGGCPDRLAQAVMCLARTCTLYTPRPLGLLSDCGLQIPSPFSTEFRPLGRPRRRWEDNIKMDLEVGWGHGLDWAGSG